MKKNLLTILIILLSLFLITGCFEEVDTPIDNPIDDPINTGEPDDKDPEKPIDKEIDINNSGKVEVKLGIDLIDDNLEIFKGKRVGLITNATGVNSNFKSTIDILYEKVNLVALFANI